LIKRVFALAFSLLILGIVILTGCKKIPGETEDSGTMIRFLALGDSYTIGESVSTEERWPAQFSQALREQGVESVDVQIIARTGWTTTDLQYSLARIDPKGPFELVSLLIGVNDQFQGRSQELYRREFRELLEQAVMLAGGEPERVLVLSIPDWGVTPFADGRDTAGIAVEIDAFNLINRIESLQMGVHYVDVTGISREALNDPLLLANDGLHPSGEMYRRWVEVILPLALDITNP